MKVITNNYKSEYPKQVICENCKSVLEYNKEDIKKEKVEMYDQRQGDYEVTITFLDCPCCKSIIKI